MTQKILRLQAPFTEDKIRSLRVGDMVELHGTLFTGRDSVHKWLHDGNQPPFSLEDSILYHCGPVVIKKQGKWIVTAAGPTTSAREEPYQAGIFERFGVRAVIGKGGMGDKTLEACRKLGCVYLHAIGGAAQVLAEKIVSVEDVFGLDIFGSPEAIWKLKVEGFPVVVTMDSTGESLHKRIEEVSRLKLQEAIK